jgi:hypothetical protein
MLAVRRGLDFYSKQSTIGIPDVLDHDHEVPLVSDQGIWVGSPHYFDGPSDMRTRRIRLGNRPLAE